MKQSELRELLHNSSQRPVKICMDDGKTYTVSHSDFALAAPDAVVLVSGPGHAFGASFVICGFEHISWVEALEQGKARPTKSQPCSRHPDPTNAALSKRANRPFQQTPATHPNFLQTAAMFIAMNRFKIAPGFEDPFEEMWRNRRSYLDEVPGFREFHLLRGPKEETHTLFASHSVWDSRKAFEAWTDSEAFRKAHSQARSPEGMHLSHPQFEGFEVVL